MSDGLHEALGAGPPTGSVQVVLFVPSVDRIGEPLNQRALTQEALEVFARLFRGSTAFPAGRGAWRDDDAGGGLVLEESQMVMSYADPALIQDSAVIAELRTYLHRLGREAKQGEVGVVIAGKYFGITSFDEGERADE